MSIDQQFVEFVVKALVSNPEDVQVERSIDEKGVLLELTVNPEDLGRVIGKRGNTAQSIRTLLRALGTKNDARYNLKIVDNGEERPASSSQDSGQASDHSDDDSGSDDSDGSNQWAHLSSNNEDADEENTDDSTDEEDDESTDSTSSNVEKRKKELADLDSLDI